MKFGFGKANHDVIYFLRDDSVVREMEFGEFEAVLDGVVSEADFAGDEHTAVFVKLDTRLNILAAVFFLIEFDDDGALKLGWDLPLEQLAETAAYGPKVNGVPVRLACRSQCPIPWLAYELWEPDLSAQSNTLKLLAAQAKQNKLGLYVESNAASSAPVVGEAHLAEVRPLPTAGESSPAELGAGANEQQALQQVTGADYQRVVDALSEREEMLRANLRQKRKEERDLALHQQRESMAQSIKKLRAQLSSARQKYQLELDTQVGQHQQAVVDLQRKLDQITAQLVAQEKRSSVLKEENNVLHEQLRLQKDEHEKNIVSMAEQNGFDHEALRKHMRRELQAKLIEHTSELESRLELKEVEANYREEQIKRLQRDIAKLKSSSLASPSNDFLVEAQRFEKSGMHFIVSLPVLGPLRIPAAELSAFRLDTEAYLASRTGVSREVFVAWWNLARNPVCNFSHRDGRSCGTPIKPCKPQEFEHGIADRCEEHEGEELIEARKYAG